MDRWTGKVALVTGASDGIGASIAEALVREGLNVIGVARRLAKLEELASRLGSAKGRFYPIRCDVTDEQDVANLFAWAEKERGGIDVLVNCAAVLVNESIIDGSTKSFRETMDVNVIAVAVFIREAVRSMRKRQSQGHIVNINSVAGHYAEAVKYPVGLYCASKYAVSAINANVRHELTAAKLDIKLTSISPGAVDTNMIRNTGVSDDALRALPMLKPNDVTEAVLYALGSPAHVQVRELIVTATEKL